MGKTQISRTFLFLIFLAMPITAGDIAQFINLGFSEDSSIFVFAQYGVHQKTSLAYSDIYLVNLEKNAFVHPGTYSQTSTSAVSPFSDGREALHSLLRSTGERLNEIKLDSMSLGRPIYILFKDETYTPNFLPKKDLSFTDRAENTAYKVTLFQEAQESAEAVSSKFHIEIEATSKDGQSFTATIGNKSRFRDFVMGYDVAQIILSPDKKSLVLIIEKTMKEGDSISLRYMVETHRLF